MLAAQDKSRSSTNCLHVYSRHAPKLTACSIMSSRSFSTSGRFQRGTGSSSTLDIWRRSIGTCCASAFWDETSFHSEFDNLFAFGIDPVDGGLPTDQPSDWPAPGASARIREQVRQALDDGLASELSQPTGQEKSDTDQLLNVAIEHRLMHAETLAYMLHQLPFDNKVRKPRQPELVVPSVEPRMIEIPAGNATLGLQRCQTNRFGWDNEYEAHTVAVPAFSIDQYEVTNREYLQFMNAGGYENAAAVERC